MPDRQQSSEDRTTLSGGASEPRSEMVTAYDKLVEIAVGEAEKMAALTRQHEKRIADLEEAAKARELARKNSNYSIDSRSKSALAVDESAFQQFEFALRDFANDNFEFSVIFSGEHSVVFNSVQDFLDDSMTRNREIRSFDFRCSDSNTFKKASLTGNVSSATPLQYKLSGDRVSCLSADEKIRDEIRGGSTWYKFLYHYEIFTFLMMFLVTFMLATLLAYSSRSFGEAMIMGLPWTILSLPASFTLSYLLPPLQILVGKSGQVMATRRSVRRYIGVALVLGTAVAFAQQWLIRQTGL